MKNKKIGLGMLAITLVFGMTVIGCDTGNGGGGDDGQKKITVTGYTTPGDGEIMIGLFANPDDFLDGEPVAVGQGIVSGSSVTFTLVTDMEGTPFTGTGSYFLQMDYYEESYDDGPGMPGDSDEEDAVYYTYLYTNGQTVAALGITSPLDIDKAPKFTISSDTSTIEFAKFKDVTDIWWIEEFDDYDFFEGTWISTNVKIVATDESWKEYTIPGNDEVIRGTYTYSGNVVTAKITEVNTANFGGEDAWVTYADLDETYKGYMGGTDTFTLTITNNSFSVMEQTFVVSPDFYGTWAHTATMEDEVAFTIVISGDEVTIKMNGEDLQKGPFAFSSERIFMKVTHEWKNGAWEPVDWDEDITFDYVYDGNTFTLSNGLVDKEPPTGEKGQNLPFFEGDWTRQ